MARSSLFAALLLVSIVPTASAQDRRAVSVTGHGETEVEPDIATVKMGIFVFDCVLLKAKREADGTIARLMSALTRLDVKLDDIRSSDLHVKPKYKERDDQWELVGYEITRSVAVTVRRMTQLNDVLNESIKAGANRLEDIALSSSKESELKEQMLTLAIEDAKRRAARLAEGFGARLGKVITIDGGEYSGSARNNLLFPAFGDATYQPARISIETDLAVVFELID